MYDNVRRIGFNENRGDFLAIFSRNHPHEFRLMSKIEKYQRLKTEQFILKKLPIDQMASTKVLQEHAYFWTSDHARFWYHNEASEFMSFPSILLSDTGIILMRIIC